MDLPDPGIKLGFPALQANSLPTELYVKQNIYMSITKNKTKLNMSQALEVTPSMLTNHKGKETQTSLHKKMYHHCKFLNKTRQNIFAKHESFISVR